MRKNLVRIVFIISLIILSGAFISTFFFIPQQQGYTESERAKIIAGKNELILQYDIVNEQEKDIKYTIFINVDNVTYTDSVVVKPLKTYNYIHHINRQQLEEGRVTSALYEEDRSDPIEQISYYISSSSLAEPQ